MVKLHLNSYLHNQLHCCRILSVCLSIRMSVCLSVRMSLCLSVYLTTCLSTCGSIYLYLSVRSPSFLLSPYTVPPLSHSPPLSPSFSQFLSPNPSSCFLFSPCNAPYLCSVPDVDVTKIFLFISYKLCSKLFSFSVVMRREIVIMHFDV